MIMPRKCVNCDSRKGLARFENDAFTIEHGGMTVTVDGLAGWRCAVCGEVEFDNESAQRYAAAGDELVMAGRMRQAQEIRRRGHQAAAARAA